MRRRDARRLVAFTYADSLRYSGAMPTIWYCTGLVLGAGLLSTCGCSNSHEPGVSVVVVLETGASSEPKRDLRRFVTNLGFEVELNHAYLSTAAVEIFACAPLGAWWNQPWIRSAHAHSRGSPTLLGTPAVASWLGSRERFVLGELTPPPATYCRAQQTIAAADADAVGLPADVDMVGKSLFVDGTYARPGDAPQAFVFSSTETLTAQLGFDAIELTPRDKTRVTLLLGTSREHWCDDIDFAAPAETAKVRTLLDNMREALRARAE